MSLLVNLPDDVAVDILSEWCELMNIGKLDTANCCSKHRQKLFSLFRHPNFVLRNDDVLTSHTIMKWIDRRGIGMEKMFFNGFSFKDNKCEWVTTAKPKTKTFGGVQLSVTGLIHLLRFFPNLTSLYISDVDAFCDSVIGSLPETLLQNLSKLTINQPSIGIGFLRFASVCRNLRIVELNAAFDFDRGLLRPLIENNKHIEQFMLGRGFEMYGLNSVEIALTAIADHLKEVTDLDFKAGDDMSYLQLCRVMQTNSKIKNCRIYCDDGSFILSPPMNQAQIDAAMNGLGAFAIDDLATPCDVLEIETNGMKLDNSLPSSVHSVFKSVGTHASNIMIIDCSLNDAILFDMANSCTEMTHFGIVLCSGTFTAA